MLTFKLTVTFTSTDYVTANLQHGLDGLILAIGRENIVNFEINGGASQSTGIRGVQVVSEGREPLPLQQPSQAVSATHSIANGKSSLDKQRRDSEMKKKWDSAIGSSENYNIKKVIEALVRCKTLRVDEITQQTGIEDLHVARNTLSCISRTCNRLGITKPYEITRKKVKGKEFQQWTWIGFDSSDEVR